MPRAKKPVPAADPPPVYRKPDAFLARLQRLCWNAQDRHEAREAAKKEVTA